VFNAEIDMFPEGVQQRNKHEIEVGREVAQDTLLMPVQRSVRVLKYLLCIHDKVTISK